MKVIGRSLENLNGRLRSFSIETFANILKAEWIEEALKACGRESERVRKLPAPFVVWLVIAMGLFRGRSIQNVLGRLGEIPGLGSIWRGGKPRSPSVADARAHVGFGPFRLVMLRLRDWIVECHREAMTWKGFLVCALDGSTFKIPDSDQNRHRFGLPKASRGRTAFPQMRALFLVSAKLHVILEAVFAPYRRSELALFWRILPSIPVDALVLMDRYFDAWAVWAILAGWDRHFLVRARKFRRPRKQRVLQRLGRGDRLVEIFTPNRERRLLPTLPETLIFREITVRIRGCWYRFLTSLLDPVQYPAEELVHLYAQRWEEEIALDEIKTHQCGATTVNRPVIFRSQTTRRVLQEAYGLVIAYNLVRCLMATAATQAAVPPIRLSFVDSLVRIRDTILLMAVAPTGLLPEIYADLLLTISQCQLPQRRNRRNPRAVCIKMSAYPLKRKTA